MFVYESCVQFTTFFPYEMCVYDSFLQDEIELLVYEIGLFLNVTGLFSYEMRLFLHVFWYEMCVYDLF